MRHELDLLTKDNDSDMQLSNPTSLKITEHFEKNFLSDREAKSKQDTLAGPHLSVDLSRHVIFFNEVSHFLSFRSMVVRPFLIATALYVLAYLSCGLKQMFLNKNLDLSHFK